MILRRKIKLQVPECIPVPVVSLSSGADNGGAPIKILVVDDDPVILKALTLKLKSRGYHSVTAGDTSAALNLARREQPRVALLDVGLTTDIMSSVDWNGFNLAQWLQHLRETEHLGIILMSGSERADYGERAAAVGAAAFLRKPIGGDELFASIDLALCGGAGSKPKCIDLPLGD